METMSSGDAVQLSMCLMRRSAVSQVVGSLGRATKCTALENQLTMVRMTVLP